MSKILKNNQVIADWIIKGLEKEGKSNTGLAKALRLAQPRIAEMRKGKRKVRATELPIIAEYIEELVPVELTPFLVPSVLIPLKGEIRTGCWTEPNEETPYTHEYVAVHLPEIYLDVVNKFAVRVQGSSMNRIYPDGTILVCVSLYDLHEDEPISGKKYLVRRTRSDGRVETTVKEVAPDEAGKWWLWPRSDDPEHQAPIPLDGIDGEEIRITARVILSVKTE